MARLGNDDNIEPKKDWAETTQDLSNRNNDLNKPKKLKKGEREKRADFDAVEDAKVKKSVSSSSGNIDTAVGTQPSQMGLGEIADKIKNEPIKQKAETERAEQNRTIMKADANKIQEAMKEQGYEGVPEDVELPTPEEKTNPLKELTKGAGTSMKDAINIPSTSEPEPTTAQPANMTFNDLASKLGIDPNNPTPEGQAALKEWLSANPDYKAGDLTNTYLNANTTGSSSTKLPYEEFQQMLRDYKKEYDLPKNGADYLRSLWKEDKGGKAKAIGNVLGNLLGAAGYGLAGKEYSTDWEDYKNRYLEEASRREGEQFDRASGLTQRMFENQQDVDKMIKSLDEEIAFSKNLSDADKLAWTSFKQAQNAGDWRTILTMFATGKLGEIMPKIEDWLKTNTGGNPLSMLNQGAK